MPSSPTHPTSLSTSLVQQPVLPAQTASLPSAAATLPLRLKVTFDLLLPLAPSPGTRHSKLAQVAQSAAVYPSPAQGGAINVQAGLTVRGQRLPTLGWASERLMAIFATNAKDLGLAQVLPWDDGRFELQTTSRAPIKHLPGDPPLAFLSALDIQLSWGSKPPRRKAARKGQKAGNEATQGQVKAGDSATDALSDEEAHKKATADAFAAEQKQITEDYTALASASDLPQAAQTMRRTLDACLLRMVQSQFVKHFPLVFNGPYAALRANDLPSIPSVAASMRTIIQNMTDKLRKKEAKRLYEALAHGLRDFEGRQEQSLKDILCPGLPLRSAHLSAFDSDEDDASVDDDVAQTAEKGTTEDFEVTVVGGLQSLWASKLRPKRLTAIRSPSSQTSSLHPASGVASPMQTDLATPSQSFEPLAFFDDDLFDSPEPSTSEVV